MRLTPGQLNRATLHRQALLRRERMSAAEAVRRAVALQAQEPASPYLALWNRIEGFDPRELDHAFDAGSIVKASLMRITLHAVHADDYTTFHEAIVANLRGSRLHDKRFKATGLTIAEADALVPDLVEFVAEPRTVAEIDRMLAERLGRPPERGVWWALRTFAPMTHSPTGGAWSFGASQRFVAAPVRPARPAEDDARQQLLWRYLEAFGPASADDFAQFAVHYRPAARAAAAALADKLVTVEGPDGTVLYDVPGGAIPAEDTPAPARLMAMWDSVLLAHADRSRVIPPEYRKLVTRSNGDVLPTLLVDGRVCGVWRAVDGGIELTAFHRLSDEAWEGIDVEAGDLLRLLATREPAIYKRYARWWSDLPVAEKRVLAAG